MTMEHQKSDEIIENECVSRTHFFSLCNG